jgi:L-ascorbate metabolism protein UlaG (beta-lactamase superfamily)
VAGATPKTGNLRIVIDAYLSDSLAKKYQGAEFPHTRLMPSPIAPEALRDIDYLLCSHGHTDHMDPETIRAIVMNNPGCQVAAPLAEKAKADGMGLGTGTFLPLDAGMVLELAPGVRLRVLPAAHESFKQDDQGHHYFLAFLLEFPGFTIFHGGDCVPYPGLVEALEGRGIALSLLPVNGRDEYRTSRGILGNFSLQESAALARDIGSDYFIGHHFGLFDFNTIDKDEGAASLAALYPELKDRYFLVDPGKAYILTA